MSVTDEGRVNSVLPSSATRGLRASEGAELHLDLHYACGSVNNSVTCYATITSGSQAREIMPHIRPVVVCCHRGPHGRAAARATDLVFTQTETVEIIDGGRDKAAVQAKRCVDTGVVAFACPGARGEWAVGTGILSRAWTAGEDTVRGVLSPSFFRRTIHGCRPSDRLSLRHSHKGHVRGAFKGERRRADRRRCP